MNIEEFKEKLDNRDFWGGTSQEIWRAARDWAIEANKDNDLINWTWDCGLKLDYDGDVCRICSRFYPPHKSHEDYGMYSGTISVMIGDADEYLHEKEIEAKTLDELKKIVEDYVSDVVGKIHDSIRTMFKEQYGQ